MRAEPHIVILGPTCCWKSETAIRLAQRLGREIVSCDSMQVYRGLEIGTAQPSQEELGIVPHHLIACLDIHEPYDVNRFLDRAGRALTGILTRAPAAVIVAPREAIFPPRLSKLLPWCVPEPVFPLPLFAVLPPI